MANAIPKHPTGFVPTTLPFLEELDAARFEQFCTDLLNFRPVISCLRHGKVVDLRIINARRLGSGAPQHGADIHADADQGEVWIFQCKRVQEFGPKEVAAAITDAERGYPHADQYVLVTTCLLSAEAQEQMDTRPNWMWWDSSRLTTETQALSPVENGINLVKRYFNKDWIKRLFVWGDQPYLKWDELFAPDLSQVRQFFHHRTEFLRRDEIDGQLEAFARNGAGRALILSGSGGQGKSRLLLELAKRLEERSEGLRVRFLNLSRRGLSEEFADLLAREKDLVLVVDDAHRLDSALGEVARATASAESVRLLVATRPQALEVVRSQLYQHGYAERLENPLHLRGWKFEDMLSLAKRVLDPQNHVHAARLAQLADGCPLLTVLGGSMINTGRFPETVTDEQDFRERVFKSFKEDFLQLQAEGKRDRLDHLMRFLSFVSPTPKNDQLLYKASEIIGCSALEVSEDIKLLQAARLVLENREGIRLYPDLFADAVLLDACLEHDGKPSFLHKEILSKLALKDFPALMRNVAQADWEARARRGASCSLFEPIWREFVHRFQEGTWLDNHDHFQQWVLNQYASGDAPARRAGRGELLGQWAAFAIYLPEKTLELAELALKSAEPLVSLKNSTSDLQVNARASACAALPSILKPVVIWHGEHAARALDILWSLDAEEPNPNWGRSSNAITVMAEAASFEVHKPIQAAESVMDWLEAKFQEAAVLERLRIQPWVASALLKPFFAREVEQTWSSGRTVHLATTMLSAEKTRPLRQRALCLAARLLSCGDTRLVHALLPVLRDAIHSVWHKFEGTATPEMQAVWLPDRLEALKVLEDAVAAHRNSPFILLQLRPMLLNRCQYDPEETIRKECRRILSGVPDTFELRVARLLTSWVHDEDTFDSDLSSEAGFKAAEAKWMALCREVALELTERFKTASALCGFIRKQAHELTALGKTIVGGDLLDSVAEISPEWCACLVEEVIAAKDNALDVFLGTLLRRAEILTPELYLKIVESLPLNGRPAHLSALINHLGRKYLHQVNLSQGERLAIMNSTQRAEEEVVFSLASVAGHHFACQPDWAIEVLRQLKPTGKHAADAILGALAQLAEKHAPKLSAIYLAQCLTNLGDHCFPETTGDDRNLDTIARWFPKQVYEQIRNLHDRAVAEPEKRHPRQFGDAPSLGPINDSEYVEREIALLWSKAVLAKDASFARKCRLALIRSLLWSEGGAALDRVRKLAAESKNGHELTLVAELAGVQGSRFVFKYSDMVRLLLVRGQEFGIEQDIREILWSSAIGGGRSFTGNVLNPEYRYILEQGEALANRYRDDSVLLAFYRLIAESERHYLETYRQAFHEEDEMD